MGAFSDNFYSWLDRKHSAEKATMDASTFEEEEHPREGKGGEGGGRFTKSEKTKRKEDDVDDLSKSEVEMIQSSSGPNFREVSAKEYAETISKAKAECVSKHAWRVDAKPESGYRDSKARIVTDKGSCIAVQSDGDIVSLCKRNGDNTPATLLMAKAVDREGDRLDTFEGNYGLYRRCGFSPISWTPFNRDFAPDGWAESGDKEEDIIFFAYTGDKKKMTRDEADEELKQWKSSHKPHTGDNGYDEAMKARNDFINNRK